MMKTPPHGYHTLTPYLIIRQPHSFIEFAKIVFDAVEVMKHLHADGAVMHAELQIGDSRLMLAEASDKWPASANWMYIFVEDVDDTYRKALGAGGVSLMEPADQFYGDRIAGIRDAFGNTWWISTRVEEVSEEELARRKLMFKEHK